jgi:hypothetical protein
MKLNKPVKVIVGLATLLYAAIPFLFFAAWLFMVLGIVAVGASSHPSEDMPFFFVVPFLMIIPLQFCFVFLHLALNIFYMVHVIKNTDGNETIRILLAIGNFIFPYFSMPIYFYLYMWTETPPDWALAPKSAA